MKTNIHLAFNFFLLFVSTEAWAKSLDIYTKYNIPRSTFTIKSASSEAAYSLSSGTYESLIKVSKSGNIETSLSSRYELTKGGVLFYLKKGVKFHNNKALVADDVIKSFKLIKELDKFSALMLSDIVNIKKISKTSVFIKGKIDAIKLIKIAMWLRVYNCQGGCSAGKVASGTGPWIPVKYDDKSIKLTKFKNYHSTSPSFNNINIFSKEISLKNINEKKSLLIDRSKVRRIDLIKKLQLNTHLLSLNISNFGIFNLTNKKTIFKDLAMRKALNLAIDRYKLLKLAFKNKGELMSSLCMKTERGCNKNLKMYSFDKKTLKNIEAKKNTFYIGLQSKDEYTRKFAKFIIRSASLIGLKGYILNKYFVSEHEKFNQTVDIVLGSDPSPYGHFEFFISNFFDERSPYFMNSDVELLRILKMSSENKYLLINTLLHNQYFGIPGVQYISRIAVSNDIKELPFSFGLLNLEMIK